MIATPLTIWSSCSSVTIIIRILGDFQPVRVAAYHVYMTEWTHRFIPAKKRFVLLILYATTVPYQQ